MIDASRVQQVDVSQPTFSLLFIQHYPNAMQHTLLNMSIAPTIVT